MARIVRTPVERVADRAQALVGRRLDQLGTGIPLVAPPSAQNKGLVGRVIEAYFGIRPNSRSEADFAALGIELKTVPIRISDGEARAKERVSIGMIDFEALKHERWETAHVRSKLDHILFVFVRWEELRPVGYFEVLRAGLWRPDLATLAVMKDDWERVRDLAASGRADQVSESLSAVLGAATKGPGHGSTTRAWSLKQPFVGWIYRSMGSTRQAIQVSDDRSHFEDVAINSLRIHAGKTLASIGRELGIPNSTSKSAGATIIRRLLGQPTRGRSEEFERFGVEVKTVPVSARQRVHESMSFPVFTHEELVYEDWESSDLLGHLGRLLIVPLVRPARTATLAVELGRPFFWSPTEPELRGIRIEWERYRALIEAGRSRDLPKASETRYIHIRPHSRRASDTEAAPGGHEVTKKSFWLNGHFVEEIIDRHRV